MGRDIQQKLRAGTSAHDAEYRLTVLSNRIPVAQDGMHFNLNFSWVMMKNVGLTAGIISGTVFQKRNLNTLERGGVKASLSALVIPFGFSTAV